MALRKAGVSLTIEGQAAYKAGIAEINREQRLLAEQSKLAVAQLGTQASRQATYSTSMSNYAKQIQVASDKTNTLRNRQKELPGVQNQIKTALDNTNASYRDSQKETERLKNNYEQMREALGSNNEATKQAKEEYQASKAETKELASEIKSLEKAYNANEKELSNLPFSLNKAEVATQQLRNEAQRLHEEYRNAGGRYADLSNDLSELGDKLTNVGGVMQSVGGFATKFVTAPLLLAGGAAIKASIDFESAFAGTKKTVDELYDANGNLIISYEDLSNGIRDMAKELPASTTEIAEVAEAAGQLGIKTENVLAFSRTMIDMGESTNLGVNDAATALARFANITGMSQDKFSNLGSSIVDLGNNFATTESEIVNMALRLAGAGNIVGMSEADIVGLSTALSSVGIEAEAGGSAISKLMVNMQLASAKGQDAFAGLQEVAERNGIAWESVEQAVANGGKELTNMSNALGLGNKGLADIYKSSNDAKASLDDFAYVAGMTGEEFAQAFQEDAVGAIGKFIEGLSHAEEKGTTAIEMLDNMGISEVRLRDALLRAGGASELFAGAIETSNKAFDENIALTEEAEKRYETTESKLRMLKNQVNDVAIEFGGPLVDALRDGMEAATPLIEKLSDMGESFSNLDEDTQRTIIKWGLFAIAGGPVLSMLGNITSGVGTLTGGMSDLVRWFGKVTTPKIVGDVTKSFAAVGGGATSAATQVGGLSTIVAGLPLVLGVTSAALLGWTAWKVWGEDAWNSAQRTREWGTDVGETVANTLTDIKDFGTQASGQFSLMSQGLTTSAGEMGENFASMGQVIEESLTNRILSLDELISNLPDTVRVSLEKMVEEDKKQAETSLAIVEENNAKIAEIREQASQHNRELSIVEAQMIIDLNKESSEAYVNTLKISQEEKKQILAAMNGDVEQASDKEARIWAQNLAKQRQEQTLHYAEQKKTYLDGLKELGYSPEFIAEHEKVWDAANKATTDGIDQQLAIIAEKYPEIAEEIFFANGQIIDSSSESASAMIAKNQEIIDSATNMSAQVAANAERNAEKLRWVADEATFAGSTWNSVVLDEKTGEVKTNVRKEIVEAGKDLATWNDMKFMLHEADIDSNAKTIIGEAAIVNGRWDTMSWGEKQIILKDEFSINTYKALEETGKWNELSVEEKTAFLYSNTPEVMAQTMLDLGLWDEYEAEIKDLDADNYEVLNAIAQSETALKQYNEAPVELKTLLANDPSTLTFQESQKALEAYNNLPEDLKVLLSNNSDAMSKIQAAQDKINNYNRNVHPGPKHLHATSNVEDVVNRATIALNGINGKVATTYVDTVRREWSNNSAGGAVNWATGTNFHQGGPMIVNDQKGPLFKELVTYPDGTSFVPEGRNVFIPDAPRGAKVLKAALTKNLIPRYEKGIGFDTRSLSMSQSSTPVSPPIDYRQLADTVGLAVTKALGNLSFDGVAMVLKDKVMGELVGNYANEQGAIKVSHKERGLAGY